MIKLNKEQHEHLIQIVDDFHLREKILQVATLNNDSYQYDMNDDLEIDLYDYLQDKQVEIGFDKDYNPNENWEKIQKIIDEVYIQMEG